MGRASLRMSPALPNSEDQSHEASLERRCDCCGARVCSAGLGTTHRSRSRSAGPKSTSPRRAGPLLPVVQSSAVVRNAVPWNGFAAEGAGSDGSWGDGPGDGARGNHIGNAADAPAYAGFNAPQGTGG